MPPATPLTTPVLAPTVATEVLLLLHVPTPSSLSVAVPLTHKVSEPAIADGAGLTVTVSVLEQVAVVYVIVAVPAARPLTTPLVPTVTEPVPSVLLHVPPSDPSLRFVVEPWQILGLPVIGDIVPTFTVTVVTQPEPVA